MARYFNTAGPCIPGEHYLLPAQRRLPGVRELIERKSYFVLHAARQSGKTTFLEALARDLREEGRFAVVHTSCEVGQTLKDDLEGSIDAVLHELPEVDPGAPPRTRAVDLLSRWAEQCPKPIVLLLDEIDALHGEALLSLLRQLRSGFPSRPASFPQSVALVGLRDVRDYRLFAGGENGLGTSSPFNVKVESLTLPNFTAAEVAELYAQHTEETGQRFTPEAIARASELTGGQPWLVNALARQCVEVLARDRNVTIDTELIDAAKNRLILRRDTHLDSLLDRLREARVRRVIAPILAGELFPVDLRDDDIPYAKDLGLVNQVRQKLELANPIYAEVAQRLLTSGTDALLALPPGDRNAAKRLLGQDRGLFEVPDDFEAPLSDAIVRRFDGWYR